VNNGVRKIIGGIILTVLWICCFLFIRPTLVIDFGGGITFNFKFTVIILGLLIIFFYNLLYRSSPEATKLSWTVSLTMAWLALMIFYPFQPLQGTEAQAAAGVEYDGAVGFFALIGGLAVCVLWVRFFSDEITI
jgi:predicted membrane channel-forming protein YqfA (hemolysin III family)